MKVILTKDHASIGPAGTVKEVKPGYGFNYLLPQGLARLATPAGLQRAEKLRDDRRTQEAETAALAQKNATLLSGKTIMLKEKATEGALFGSVGKKEISAALKDAGFLVEPDAIMLAKPLKKIGRFPVRVEYGSGEKGRAEIFVEIQAQ